MNKRIKKKKNCPWIQLKKYKPKEVAVFSVDFNDDNADMGFACDFMNRAVEFLPEINSAIMLPNFITLQFGDKEFLRKMIDKAEEIYETLWNE